MTRYVNGGISKDERNHPVCKLEFLAFSWARTENFYDLLYGNTLTVHTNTNPLTSVLSLAKSDDTCKIQKNRRNATVTPTIEHQGGHPRTPAKQRWDQVPGRSQRLPLGQQNPPWTPATQRKCIYESPTPDEDRHYIGSVTATTPQEKGHRWPRWKCQLNLPSLYVLWQFTGKL